MKLLCQAATEILFAKAKKFQRKARWLWQKTNAQIRFITKKQQLHLMITC